MTWRSGLVIIVAVVIGVLAALNWGQLAQPVAISLGVTGVTAPLGLVMLGLTVVLAVLLLAYVIYIQGATLLQTRRHHKELQAQRNLADNAEASRLTELRSYLDTQEQMRQQRLTALQTQLLARIEQLETALNARAEQSDNSICAHLGELEDRFERSGTLPSSASA